MSEELQIAIEAAKKGAEKALYYFTNQPKVTIKPDNSPVTIADKETEAVIKSFLLSHDSKARFVGEETGGDFAVDEAWIIDPIDGTKNFIRSLSAWAILLAHYKNGVCDIGISYIPVLDQMCYAEKGKGAFINGKKIQVSSISKLSDAYFSHGEMRYFTNTNSLITLSTSVLTERCHGDALSYNLLANGNMDIVIDARAHVWDAAAQTVIIPEAGGKISNFKGQEWSITDLDFVATNGTLHDEVIEILNLKE